MGIFQQSLCRGSKLLSPWVPQDVVSFSSAISAAEKSGGRWQARVEFSGGQRYNLSTKQEKQKIPQKGIHPPFFRRKNGVSPWKQPPPGFQPFRKGFTSTSPATSRSPHRWCNGNGAMGLEDWRTGERRWQRCRCARGNGRAPNGKEDCGYNLGRNIFRAKVRRLWSFFFFSFLWWWWW